MHLSLSGLGVSHYGHWASSQRERVTARQEVPTLIQDQASFCTVGDYVD